MKSCLVNHASKTTSQHCDEAVDVVFKLACGHSNANVSQRSRADQSTTDVGFLWTVRLQQERCGSLDEKRLAEPERYEAQTVDDNSDEIRPKAL